MTYAAIPASADVHALGEGPVWDPVRGRLLWVDIVAGVLHEGVLDPGTGLVTATGRHAFGSTVAAVAVAGDGRLIVAEKETLTRVDLDGRRTEPARVLPDGVRSRLNDGAVDPAGRFLVGSLAQDDRGGEEVLVRLDRTGLTHLDTDLTLSNGLAWIGERLYSVDTGAPHTSSVAFAGPDLDLLVITTSTLGLTEADLAAHPDSGRLFTCRPGVRGLPTPYWNPF
ncbi:MAG: SMP-30/gluconolactonase/LRE family protein [Nonomuraea sp.]|nr:SMP-30/gluconolactonase/LRE family protein [Nonomuraea sp.]